MFDLIKLDVSNPNYTSHLGFSKSRNNPSNIKYFVEIINNKTKDIIRHYIDFKQYKLLEKINEGTKALQKRIKINLKAKAKRLKIKNQKQYEKNRKIKKFEE